MGSQTWSYRVTWDHPSRRFSQSLSYETPAATSQGRLPASQWRCFPSRLPPSQTPLRSLRWRLVSATVFKSRYCAICVNVLDMHGCRLQLGLFSLTHRSANDRLFYSVTIRLLIYSTYLSRFKSKRTTTRKCFTDRQTDRQADGQTDRQTDVYTDRQTDKETDKQTYIQTDRHADRHANTYTDRQTDR